MSFLTTLFTPTPAPEPMHCRSGVRAFFRDAGVNPASLASAAALRRRGGTLGRGFKRNVHPCALAPRSGTARPNAPTEARASARPHERLRSAPARQDE